MRRCVFLEMNQALVYNILSAFFSVLLVIIVKVMVNEGGITPEMTSFLRHIAGLFVIMPFMIKTLEKNPHYFVHKIPHKLIVWRAILFTVATFIWPVVYTHISLHIAMTIVFAVPFISNILLVVFLKERIPKHVWIAKIIGFIGVVLILEPYVREFNIYYLLAFISVILWSVSTVLNKKIADLKVKIDISLYYLTIYAVILTSILVMIFEIPMPKNIIKPILYLGFIGVIGQILQMKAYGKGSGYLVNAMEFVKFLLFLVSDIIIFGAELSKITILGASIIGVSVFYIIKKY